MFWQGIGDRGGRNLVCLNRLFGSWCMLCYRVDPSFITGILPPLSCPPLVEGDAAQHSWLVLAWKRRLQRYSRFSEPFRIGNSNSTTPGYGEWVYPPPPTNQLTLLCCYPPFLSRNYRAFNYLLFISTTILGKIFFPR